MNLAAPHNRKEYLKFFQNDFLTDSFEITDEEIKPELKTNYINQITFIGKDPELELNVYEIKHNSVNDPRVGLSKESFRLMAQYGVRKALILFVSENSDNYRLSLVTIDLKLEGEKVKREYSNPRRYSFFLGPDAKLHTPEKFLISKGRVKDFEDLQSRFSVEVVNKEFYQQIALKFTELTGGKRKIGSRVEDFRRKLSLPSVTEPEIYQEFSVRLIGRLVFCWFLKMKKSEVGVPLIPEEILSLEASKNTSGYYHEVLEKLFFEILNTDIDERKDEFKKEPFSLIPFLNGGLFTPHQHDFFETYKTGVSKHLNTLKVPDTWLREFIEILETYNFTVDENTSVDIDLSVDPEMLGRIFENLLAEINPETGESARKATGSYYTPRPIVEYMVDESLKQYLITETTIEEDKLAQLLSYTDEDFELTDSQKQKIVDALDKVKILDPACGSGAFPIGVLQKMLLILQKVDPDSELWLDKQLKKVDIAFLRDELKRKLSKGNVDYLHKLGIIQNSIYGVDIQPIAAEISKLRCFLSLIVDELVEDKKKNRGILPLPNLEFKFVSANTLIGLPAKQEQEEIFNVDDEVSDLEEIRKQYFTSTGKKKKVLEEKFIETQKKLAKSFINKNAKEERALKLTNWNPFSDEPSDWFDTEWMFGVEDGFNIVIGNPPYISISKLHPSIKKTYSQQSFEVFCNTSDLYCLFTERSTQLLKNEGILVLITSNQWLQADYGKSLQKYLSTKTSPLIVINMGGYRVFENATVDTSIILLINSSLSYTAKGVNIKAKDLPITNFENFVKSNSCPIMFSDDRWFIGEEVRYLLSQKIKKRGKPLSNFNINIYRGILTGLNQAFIIDSKTKEQLCSKEPKAVNIIKPLLRGRDIRKYDIKYQNKWIILSQNGIDIQNDYPQIFEYLKTFGDKIKTRADQGKNWWNLRACSYYDAFNEYKIVYPETSVRRSEFYLDKEQFILDKTCFFIVGDNLKYINALLCSKLLEWYLEENLRLLGKSSIQYSKQYIENVPLIDCIQVNLVNDLVDKIYFNKNIGKDTKLLENKIDLIVYKLYNISYKEIKTIDPEIEKIISKEEYEEFKLEERV